MNSSSSPIPISPYYHSFILILRTAILRLRLPAHCSRARIPPTYPYHQHRTARTLLSNPYLILVVDLPSILRFASIIAASSAVPISHLRAQLNGRCIHPFLHSSQQPHYGALLCYHAAAALHQIPKKIASFTRSLSSRFLVQRT